MELDAIIVAIILGVYLWYAYHKYSRLPPGPKGLPIVGYLPFFNGGKTHEILAKLGQRYGGLFTVYYGTKPVLVLNDWPTIKEVLVKEGATFSSRPDLFLFRKINAGIAFNDGPAWKCLRSFCIKHMGFQRIAMENNIIEEALVVVRTLLGCLDDGCR